MNKIFKLGVLLLAFFLAVFPVEAKLNIFAKPRYMPALNFYSDSGKAYRLSDFDADLLLAMVWSRHCGPCLNDLEMMDIFSRKVARYGIKVILISPAEEWKTPEERYDFLKRFKAPNLVTYLDQKSSFMKGMGIMVTPTVLLVNKKGQEVGQITGSTDWSNPKVIKYIRDLKDNLD